MKKVDIIILLNLQLSLMRETFSCSNASSKDKDSSSKDKQLTPSIISEAKIWHLKASELK